MNCTCSPPCTDDICFSCGARLNGKHASEPGPVRRALDRHALAVAALTYPPTKAQQAEVDDAYRELDRAMSEVERKRTE